MLFLGEPNPLLLFTVHVNEPNKSRTKSLQPIAKRTQRMKNCMVTNKRLHYEMELEDAEIIGIHKLVCKRVETKMITNGEVQDDDVPSNETSSYDDHQLMEQGTGGDTVREEGGSLAALRESLREADPAQFPFLGSTGPFGLFRRHAVSKAEPDVIELNVTDPAAMYRQLQDMEERLKKVESAVENLLPELEPIFDKFKTEQALEGERARIQSTPYLHDYYVLVQMRVIGMTTACNAISSGMVGNEGGASAADDAAGLLASAGTSILEFAADAVSAIPFSGAATTLLTAGLNAYAEHQKAERVKTVQFLFYSPTR